MTKQINLMVASMLMYSSIVNGATQIDINATSISHTVSPLIQGQGLVYSEEADVIYADGTMAQLFQDVGAGFLRWPGGTVATMYHWNDLTGVGWIDKWDPNYNSSNDSDPSAYMDLDEYIALSQAADTEPMLGINMSSGIEWDREAEALQEAKDMISYCIAQGFDVKYFYLDNETYHHGNGYNKDKDNDGEAWTPQLYAEQINIYAAAIKSLVPDAVLIANWTDKVRTNTADYTTIINVAGDNIDYIDVHWYWKWGVSTWDAWKAKTPMENETEWYDGGTFIEEMQFFDSLTTSLGKPHIKLAALEWNIAPGDHNTNPEHTPFKTALMASEMQMQFIQGGLDLGAMWTTQWQNSSTAEFQFLVNSDDGYAPSPMAHVFELYKYSLNGHVVSTSSTDGQIMATTVIKGDKAYVYVLSKRDNSENAEFSISGYDILSVESAKRFTDPGDVVNIGLWNNASNGNYMATILANTLTMVEFNVEPVIPENLINNGDFESGLSNWTTWNNPTTSNSDAFAGSASAKFIDKGSINQVVNVLPSTTYTLSAFMKSSDSSQRLVLGVNDGVSNEGLASVDSYDTSYTFKHLTFTTDANTTSVKVYAWQPPSNNASAFIDEIKLKPFNVSIENGDFEQGLSSWNTWNSVNIDSLQAFNGANALQLDGNASANQFIVVKPNTSYTVSAYAKVEDSNNAKVVFGVKDGVTNSTIDKVDIYDSSYTKQQITFTTGATTDTLKIYYWRPQAGQQASYLDDVKIVENF